MARPREFDEASVLEVAMLYFWSKGYEATSVRDLAEQMGFTSASLYNAFGDKRSLYRPTLDHYLQLSVHDRVRRLERLPRYSAIRLFFDEIVERSVTDRQRRGCMLVNTALELAAHDHEFQEIVSEELGFIEQFFRKGIVAGLQDGTLTRGADELAQLLLSVLLGMRVLARTRPQRSVPEGAADTVMKGGLMTEHRRWPLHG
jgi:TetR/AcrR family transcriptional regulator, transcriptional repressor for nem operon